MASQSPLLTLEQGTQGFLGLELSFWSDGLSVVATLPPGDKCMCVSWGHSLLWPCTLSSLGWGQGYRYSQTPTTNRLSGCSWGCRHRLPSPVIWPQSQFPFWPAQMLAYSGDGSLRPQSQLSQACREGLSKAGALPPCLCLCRARQMKAGFRKQEVVKIILYMLGKESSTIPRIKQKLGERAVTKKTKTS